MSIKPRKETALSSVIRCTAAAITVLGILATAPAQAQWRFEPVLKVGYERDDNATLSTRTDDVLDVTGILYEAGIRFDYTGVTSDFFATPRIVSRNYSDNPEIDSNDFFLNSLYSWESATNEFSVRLAFDDQSARTAERADNDLDEDDPDSIPDDDSGLVRFQGKRQRLRIRPYYRHWFTNASSISASLMYLETTYDAELQPFLDDYSDFQIAVSYNRAFSERTTGIVRARARQFDVTDGGSQTDGVGLLAGIEHNLSETTSILAMIGMEDSDSDVSEADPEVVADISLRRQLQTVNFLAQYRRSLSASGSGRLSVRDQINMNLSRRLSDNFIAGLGMRAYQTNSLDDVLTIDERTYVQLLTQVIWNIGANFAAEFEYRYTFQDREALLESANSNQVTLWFVYRPNSIDRRFR